MTRAVVTARPDATFTEVAQLLVDNGISAVPVVDDRGAPIGVVSEADLLVKQEYWSGGRDSPGRIAGRARRARWRRSLGTTANDVMSRPVLTIDPGAPVSEAASALAEANVRRLFVVDRDGALVGVLTRLDLLRAYLRDDDDLREDVRRFVFRTVLRVDPDAVDVVVDAGVVTLSGQLDRRGEVDIAVALTRALPGVVEVRGELVHRFEDP